MIDRRRILKGSAALLASCASGITSAADYPNRPVKLLVGFPPGGSVDILGRVLAEQLEKRLKSSFVVENKPGAIGTIALNLARAAEPDGHTILLGTNPQIRPGDKAGTTSYDSLEPIALAAFLPVTLLANPKAPFASFAEMLAMAKGSGRQVTCSSPGAGSPMHLAIEAINASTGSNILHVPYKGGPPAALDAMSGEVDMVAIGLPTAYGYVKAGRLKPLALLQRKRSSLLPDVPTVAEVTGKDAIDFQVWLGLFAPGKTDGSIVQTIGSAVGEALQDQTVRQRLIDAAIEPAFASPKALSEVLVRQSDLMIKAMADADRKPR